MANNLEVNRSVQFVSLDTHPANNALVVTYEISVHVLDQLSRREVSRRNKRDQLQISISALDNLTEKDLKADKLVVNLQELSAEIIRKCPLLLSERNNLEDIQLHLLYLIGRRQSQLLAQMQAGNAAGDQAGSRPASSAAGARLVRSGQSAAAAASQAGRASSRYGQAGARRGVTSAGGGNQLRSASSLARHGSNLSYDQICEHNQACSAGDVYGQLYAKEASAGPTGRLLDTLEPIGEYMEHFDEHLMQMEDSLEPVAQSLAEFYRARQAGQPCDLEGYLEGLYGDNREKLISMSTIRHLTREQGNLAGIASNRLLVCAMLRTLRDTSAPTALAAPSSVESIGLSESIFYCLIRFTSFEDIQVRVFVEGDPIDLVKVITDLLADHVRAMRTSANELKLLLERHYYTNSLLIILMNLIRIDANQNQHSSNRQQQQQQQQQQQRHRHILSLQQQQQGSRLLGALSDLLQLAGKYLAKDIRLLSKPERITSLVSRVIFALRQLCIFKEFVAQLRARQGFVESTINLMTALQLGRTASGAPTGASQAAQPSASCNSDNASPGDKRTLNELYELEINLLKLVNNLIFDRKFRVRLIRRNLLKCVLRNLVVFLASRKTTNTLSPFQRSSVLLVPFKSLYELSCDEPVKGELYRSKIIMRCLLEYLLSTTIDLKQTLETLRQQQQAGGHHPTSGSARRTGSSSSAAASLADRQSDRQFPQQPRAAATATSSSAARGGQPVDDQIVVCLEPDSTTAADFILSLWLNLSSRRTAAIYSDEPELREFVCEYIELTVSNLRAHLASAGEQQHSQTAKQAPALKSNSHNRQCQQSNGERLSPLEMTVYLHLKLLRNLTQFLQAKQAPEPGGLQLLEASCSKWVELVGRATSALLELSAARCCLSPLAVECLASLGHLISLSQQQQHQEDIDCPRDSSARAPAVPSPQQIGPLLERLLLVNANGAGDYFEAENDDLLLVSVLFLGTLARSFEICRQPTIGSVDSARLVAASNFILETKSTDRELIIASLWTLGQLLNHSCFLGHLAGALFSAEDAAGAKQHRQPELGPSAAAGQLVDKLAGLMLSGDAQVARLAVILLNRLRQLEEHRSLESALHTKRFVAYNEKWLSAIRVSREELILVDSGGLAGAQAGLVGDRQQMGAGSSAHSADEKLTIDELSQLRAVESENPALVEEPTLGGHLQRPRTGQKRGQRGAEPSVQRAEEDGADEHDDDGDEEDDDEEDDDEASLAAPDLNVIDANSMIKHLTSRRQFRSEWLRK